MEITILGTGGPKPTEGRVQSGVLVREGGRQLLIDCGSGIYYRLQQSEHSVTDLSTVLVTHHHPDHVHDIVSLLVARWLSDTPELHIVGPPGTEEVTSGFLDVYDYVPDEVSFSVTEVDPGQFELEGFTIHAAETRHSIYNLAYRIENQFTYSGDTVASDDLIAFADGSDVLLHECSFPDGAQSDSHTDATSLGKAISGADINRVYLTHLYPAGHESQEELISAVRSNFDGDVAVAYDGLEITLD